MPKTNADCCREYRKRVKEKTDVNKIKTSSTERVREFRARQRELRTASHIKYNVRSLQDYISSTQYTPNANIIDFDTNLPISTEWHLISSDENYQKSEITSFDEVPQNSIHQPISSYETPYQIKVERDAGVRELKKLNSFKKFMQDRQLKRLTRDQLEELCIQKICESIIQRSEIGELKLKIKEHEQVLDYLRKEVMLLHEQTHVLNVAHQRIIKDVARIEETSDRSLLVIPKITRSVGLQAVVREDEVNFSRSQALAMQTKSPGKDITKRETPTARIILQPTLTQTLGERSELTSVISKKTNLPDENDKRASLRNNESVKDAKEQKCFPVPDNQTMKLEVVTTKLEQPDRTCVRSNGKSGNKHPGPLPIPVPRTEIPSTKPYPPKPVLQLKKTVCGTGVVLSWKMPRSLEMFEEIANYELYAYQETDSRNDNWGKIGDLRALELPMEVTLTELAVGNKYYFAVRAVDVLTRHGYFSDYQKMLL